MKEKLGFGHLGNGVAVWDSNREKNNDYLSVAHISEQGAITYYNCALSIEAKEEIELFAIGMKSTFASDKKSKECSRVLQLLDQGYTYKQAIDTVLGNSYIIKSKLEEELNLYI